MIYHHRDIQGPGFPHPPPRGPPPQGGPPRGGPHRGPEHGPHRGPPPEPFGLKETPVKGLLNVAILELVRDEETYGSEIHRNLKDKFALDEQKPVIYGLLRRMEDMDLLSSKWDTKGGGPARRVYFITEDGLEYLEEALLGLERVKDVIEVLLAGRER